MSNSEWLEIGTVGVDGGSILMIDPAYIDETYVAHGLCYETEFVAGGATGSFGLGIFMTTGLGDGEYPVEVRYIDHPDFGRRIAEPGIRFLPD